MINLPQVSVAAPRERRERQSRERLVAGLRWQEFDLVFASTREMPLDGSNQR